MECGKAQPFLGHSSSWILENSMEFWLGGMPGLAQRGRWDWRIPGENFGRGFQEFPDWLCQGHPQHQHWEFPVGMAPLELGMLDLGLRSRTRSGGGTWMWGILELIPKYLWSLNSNTISGGFWILFPTISGATNPKIHLWELLDPIPGL